MNNYNIGCTDTNEANLTLSHIRKWLEAKNIEINESIFAGIQKEFEKYDTQKYDNEQEKYVKGKDEVLNVEERKNFLDFLQIWLDFSRDGVRETFEKYVNAIKDLCKFFDIFTPENGKIDEDAHGLLRKIDNGEKLTKEDVKKIEEYARNQEYQEEKQKTIENKEKEEQELIRKEEEKIKKEAIEHGLDA